MAHNPLAWLRRVFSAEPRPSLAHKLELLEQRLTDGSADAEERLRGKHK